MNKRIAIQNVRYYAPKDKPPDGYNYEQNNWRVKLQI